MKLQERGYEKPLLEIYRHALKARHLAESRPCELEEAVVDHLYSAVGELEEQIVRLRLPTSVDEIRAYQPTLRFAGLSYLLDEYANARGRPFEVVREVEAWKDYLGEEQAHVESVLAAADIHCTDDLVAWLRQHQKEF
jgi:hypothetical protein